jgi:hypothetical protein
MMVTPEMMEKLGGKRGKARGPDMTNVVVGEGGLEGTSYAGMGSLEEALGGWDSGRSRGRRHKKAQRDLGTSYRSFRAENDRLEETVQALRGYRGGLRRLCESQETVAALLVAQVGAHDSAIREVVQEFQEASMPWCSTSDPRSLFTRMNTMIESVVIEPIAAHLVRVALACTSARRLYASRLALPPRDVTLGAEARNQTLQEVRREVEQQLSKVKKGEELQQLEQETAVFAEALPSTIRWPLEALRRCQIEFMASAASAMSGEDESVSQAAAMSERGRALTGRSGLTPRPAKLSNADERQQTSPRGAGSPLVVVPQSPSQMPRSQQLWSGAADVNWLSPPLAVALGNCSSISPRLTAAGRWGWVDGSLKPVIFVRVRNLASVRVDAICIEIASSSSQLQLATPLQLAYLCTGEEAHACVPLEQRRDIGAGNEDTPQASDDAFDSFFGARDDDVRVAEIPRGQPGSARSLQSNVTIQLSSSMDPSVQTELRLPCQVVLAPKPMTYGDFQQLWSLYGAAIAGQPPELSSGITRCIRVEDSHVVGYAQFSSGVKLQDVRQELESSSKFATLPSTWVFVKGRAPVSQKAENKWRVCDLDGPDVVLRGKSSSQHFGDGATSTMLDTSTGSASQTHEILKPKPACCSFEVLVSRRISSSVANMVQILRSAGLYLISHVETETQTILLLSSTVDDDDVVVLLQLEIARQSIQAQGSASAPDGHAICSCEARGTQPAGCTVLMESFETCVRSFLADEPDFTLSQGPSINILSLGARPSMTD